MLNVNRIGHQVSFRALSSADLNQKYQAGTAPSSNEKPQLTDETVKKSSHSMLKTVGVILALVGAGYLAKTGKLGETAQKYFAQTAEKVSPYLESAKTSVTGAYESVKTKVLELKDKAVGVFKKAKKVAE